MPKECVVYSAHDLRPLTFDEIAEAMDFDPNRKAYYKNAFGELFVVLVSKRLAPTIYATTIWNVSGSTALGRIATCDVDEMLRFIERRAVDWSSGYVYCSECGAKMRRFNSVDIGGRYFAGAYCRHCWEGKWRAVEARETYD